MLLFPIQSDFTEKLPYFFRGVGYRYEQEHVIRPGGRPETEWSHKYYQMIQSVQGRGKVVLQGEETTVHPGQIVLLVPGEPHEYEAVNGQWEVNWIIFSGENVEYFMKEVLEIEQSGVYSLSAPKMIADKIELLYYTFCSSNPRKDGEGSTLIYNILMDIYRLICRKQMDSVSERTDKLEAVFHYIDNHYQNPIALSDLAPLAGITEQHLCTSFKKLTGHTIFEYLMKYRIQKSKELLIHEKTMQIKEIALRCGFRDVSYFGMIFKKQEFMTPLEFRKIHV